MKRRFSLQRSLSPIRLTQLRATSPLPSQQGAFPVGLLPPRQTSVQRTSIPSPVQKLTGATSPVSLLAGKTLKTPPSPGGKSRFQKFAKGVKVATPESKKSTMEQFAAQAKKIQQSNQGQTQTPPQQPKASTAAAIAQMLPHAVKIAGQLTQRHPANLSPHRFIPNHLSNMNQPLIDNFYPYHRKTMLDTPTVSDHRQSLETLLGYLEANNKDEAQRFDAQRQRSLLAKLHKYTDVQSLINKNDLPGAAERVKTYLS